MANEKGEAEHAIRNALFVLGCIAHDSLLLKHVASAIDLYAAGSDEAATKLARAIAKGRDVKGINGFTSLQPRSLDELRVMFAAAQRTRQAGQRRVVGG